MAAGAVAALSRANLAIQHHFFSADAVRSDRAVTFTPSNSTERRQFEKMLERGTIKREGADKYWLDVVAYDIDVHQRHGQTRAALLTIIALLAVATIALTLVRGHAA